MKKLLSIILCIAMLLALCSCTVKLSTTNTLPGPVVEDDPEPGTEEISYDTLTIEEKMEYRSIIDLVPATDYNELLLAPAQDAETGLWGYIDLKGEWVIQPKYIEAYSFSGDLAAVINDRDEVLYINRTGKVEHSAIGKRAFKTAYNFSEGILNVGVEKNSELVMTYMGTDGKTAINISKLPTTKGIKYQTKDYLELATPFRNGLAVVMRITNATLAESGAEDETETAYIISNTGAAAAVLPPGLDPSVYGFDDNMLVIVQNVSNGLCGASDENGVLVIPCSYAQILHCDGELYLCQNTNGLWGFVNKDGEIVVGFEYEDAHPFSEGLAAVYDGEGWGFINKSGDIVIDCVYDEVGTFKTPVVGDSSNSGAFSSGVAVVRKGGFWGVINASGDIKFAAETEECPVRYICNSYISFEYDGACGVFTTEGNYVLLPAYQAVGEFR